MICVSLVQRRKVFSQALLLLRFANRGEKNVHPHTIRQEYNRPKFVCLVSKSKMGDKCLLSRGLNVLPNFCGAFPMVNN